MKPALRCKPEQADLERGEHATAHINKFRRHNETRLTMQAQQVDLERGEHAMHTRNQNPSLQ